MKWSTIFLGKKTLRCLFSINPSTLNLIVLVKNPPPNYYKIQYYINTILQRPYCCNICFYNEPAKHFPWFKTAISLQGKATSCSQGNITSATSVNKIRWLASKKITELELVSSSLFNLLYWLELRTE